MKYENLKKAGEVCEEIDRVKKMITELYRGKLTVRIASETGWHIAYAQVEAKEITDNFIEQFKDHLLICVALLINELDTL